MAADSARPSGDGTSRAVAWVAPTVATLACLLVWEAAVRWFGVPIYLLPAPSGIVYKMFADYRIFYVQAIPTLSAILIGFGMAVAIGVPIATFMVYSPLFRHSVEALLITAQVLPKVALAPLFIVWFGFGLLPKVLMTFLIAFFPVVIDSVIGLASVRPESLMLVRSMGASRWKAFWKIRLPYALPSMFGGFKVAITFAVVGTLVAEFVGSDSGLGYVLVVARGDLDTLTVFAAIGWLVVIGFFFYYAVELLEKFVLRNRGRSRAHELGAGL
ncbi:MAG: ABC transporter permease [Betaproteobacteria bacterium]|nr:MAG: ABC transporter permease [Betaproteobacteria bacterium]